MTSSPTPSSRACDDLTMQMARDAEGMTRIAHLTVTGASSDDEARIAAKNDRREQSRQMQLVRRRSLLGTAAGRGRLGGVELDVGSSRVSYGGIAVAKGGCRYRPRRPGARRAYDGRRGRRSRSISAPAKVSARMIGIDLGPGYIKENSKTS